MSVSVGRYRFEGPFTDTRYLRNEQGVYTVLCYPLVGQPTVVDVGESEDVRSRIENHDRQGCWRRNCSATLGVAVLYTPGSRADQRRAVEHELRQQFQPACGER
jgi:hypothetical protein